MHLPLEYKENGEERKKLVLPLSEERPERSPSAPVLKVRLKYLCVLKNIPEECAGATVSLFLNGKQKLRMHLRKVPRNNEIVLNCAPHLFSECVSSASIALKLSFPDRETVLYAPPLSVVVPEGKEKENLERIISFVRLNSRRILENREAEAGVLTDQKLRELLESAEKVVNAYEIHREFFRRNPKKKTVAGGEVSSFEKIKRFSAETLRYIAQHPGELVPAPLGAGIGFQGSFYVPKRTWMKTDDFSTDTYENQVVLGFLKTFILTGETVLEKIGTLISKLHFAGEEGHSFAVTNTSKASELFEFKRRYESLLYRAKAVFQSLKSSWECRDLHVSSIPKLTSTFRLLAPYRQIYRSICVWLERDAVKTVGELNLDVVSSSRIYEYYCLLKIIEIFQEQGYKLAAKERISWPYAFQDLEHQVSANTFYLRKGEDAVTVYYEPSITSSRFSFDHGIGLYRNSTGSIDEDNSGWVLLNPHGVHEHIYTPDFIIKMRQNGKSKYIIADAKYSKKHQVEREQLVKMMFKYLLSVSPVNAEHEIDELWVLCGKLETSLEREDFVFNLRNPVEENNSPGKVKVIEFNEKKAEPAAL